MNRRNLFFGAVVCLCSMALSGRLAGQELMRVEDAIAIGLKNNYNILMAKNAEEAAALDYRYAFGAFLPVISGSATRSWTTANIKQKYSNGNDVERESSHSNNIHLSADLDWTLFDGLRVFATKDKLKAIQEAGALSVKAQVVNTIANIIQAYYNIVQTKQQLQSLAEQMSISEERVKIADNKFRSGLGSKIELLQAQVDLNAQKAAQLQQQTLITQNKAILNQLIALPADNDYAVSDSIPVDLNLSYPDIEQAALAQNPELLFAKKNIDISRLSLKEVLRSRLPVISFNSAYVFNKQASQAGFSLFNQSLGFNYGFSASIPILQGFSIKRQAESAKLDIAYQELNYANQQSQVSLELQNAYKDYQYYKQAIQLEEQNVQVAEENAQVTLAAFRVGQITSLEVKEAQRSLAEAQFRLITARYNAKEAETRLLRLRGDLLK